MAWLRNRQIAPKKLALLRSRLYHKLHKEAFDNYFECSQCGGHQDLLPHHLAYDPDNFDNPGWYTILCKDCHNKLRRK